MFQGVPAFSKRNNKQIEYVLEKYVRTGSFLIHFSIPGCNFPIPAISCQWSSHFQKGANPNFKKMLIL